jgi:arylsulfatase
MSLPHSHLSAGQKIGGFALAAALVLAMPASLLAQEQDQAATKPTETGKDKPNILVIFGDDIGIANLSVYSDGVMGYETPNIDRIGNEGIRFLHYYGEQSCTAGRSAFLTGQHIIRTGLSKVGFPGAPMGMSQRHLEESRLRHRAVRQEPCRRSQRVASLRQRVR